MRIRRFTGVVLVGGSGLGRWWRMWDRSPGEWGRDSTFHLSAFIFHLFTFSFFRFFSRRKRCWSSVFLSFLYIGFSLLLPSFTFLLHPFIPSLSWERRGEEKRREECFLFLSLFRFRFRFRLELKFLDWSLYELIVCCPIFSFPFFPVMGILCVGERLGLGFLEGWWRGGTEIEIENRDCIRDLNRAQDWNRD